MKKTFIYILIVGLTALTLTFNGCKTSDVALAYFSIEQVSGYSKKIQSLDPDDNGKASIDLAIAIRNQLDVSGTIVSWSFKIKRNIVTLLEINNNNYQNYNLTVSGNMVIPAEGLFEFFVNTPQPAEENALPTEDLNFHKDTPNEIMVEVEVQDEKGEVHRITGKGSYVLETEFTDESKYNIIGEWRFSRIVNGATQPRQKIVFVGTKTSGRYVLYNLGVTASGLTINDVFETGSFVVSGIVNLTFTSDEGTQYWGTFSEAEEGDGTLLIPPTFEGKNQIPAKTGTWTMKKL
jgi:hypothetical protein